MFHVSRPGIMALIGSACETAIRMNLRHAPALALVGWYLMVPPIQGNSETDAGVILGAPISEWNIESSYDTASECEKGLAQLKQDAEQQTFYAGVSELDKRNFKLSRESAHCIATDDPRLAK